MRLTDKQAEYIQKANKLINLKIGAKGSGKTFIDAAYIIPKRIIERKGKDGLIFIVGVTKETIERNVLKLLRKHYGTLVGEINSRNVCRMFGENVYCLGAEKVNQITKIQGSTAKYVYGDEVVRWNEEVFMTMLATLRAETSCFDGACNPEFPTHYIKKFIDSPDNQQDLYVQHYTIDDNTFYPTDKKESLKRQYAGTVYFDRYIKGLWTRAEGIIYKLFADNPERYFIKKDDIPRLMEVSVGVDFGGESSAHAFVSTGYFRNYDKLIALMSERHNAQGTTAKDVDRMAVDFVGKVIAKYGKVSYVEWDNESSVLGRGIREAIERKYPQVIVRPCYKSTIKNRIDLMSRLLGLDKFRYTEDCETLKNSLSELSWNPKKDDERLDDGSTDNDTADAFEYCYSRNINYFIK